MRYRHQFLAVLTAVALFAAIPAFGQGTPVAANSTAVLNSAQPAISIYVLPNGTGSLLALCYGFGGVQSTATIDVTLLDINNQPVPAVTERDIRLEHLTSPMNWCANSFYPPPIHAPNCADGPSNLAGQAFFSMAYHGGGWQFQNCRVWVREASGNFQPLPQILPVSMNSPDINGDLVVNLTDVVLFAQDLFSGTAPYRSDFNWDGAINLSDIAIFALGLGVACP